MEREREKEREHLSFDWSWPNSEQDIPQYSILYFLFSLPLSRSLSPLYHFLPLNTKGLEREKEGKRLILRLKLSNSYSNWKSMLSIFSHSFIVLLFLRGIRIKAGFNRNQTGLSRNWETATTFSQNVSTLHTLKRKRLHNHSHINSSITMSNMYRGMGWS